VSAGDILDPEEQEQTFALALAETKNDHKRGKRVPRNKIIKNNKNNSSISEFSGKGKVKGFLAQWTSHQPREQKTRVQTLPGYKVLGKT
jgi:hypothetical protein